MGTTASLDVLPGITTQGISPADLAEKMCKNAVDAILDNQAAEVATKVANCLPGVTISKEYFSGLCLDVAKEIEDTAGFLAIPEVSTTKDWISNQIAKVELSGNMGLCEGTQHGHTVHAVNVTIEM